MFDFATTSRRLATPAGALHYHEAGDGPPLVLLHGSGPGVSGWGNFAGNLPVFAGAFRTLILDLPGYGSSDDVDGIPLEVGAAAVLRLLDGLGIARADLLGNSMGGIIASHVAARHPDRVRRLATMGGIGLNLFTGFPGEGIRLLVEFAEAPSKAAMAAWLRSMVYDPSLITDALVEERYARATEPGALANSRRMYSAAAVAALAHPPQGAPLPWAYLPSIEAPTLLLWGRDDRVSPLDRAILPMRLIPRAELHTFPHCGHWAQIERKEEFESIALAFFGRA
jgi:pimeloyl-ACP methyl ester carboxylesterase